MMIDDYATWAAKVIPARLGAAASTEERQFVYLVLALAGAVGEVADFVRGQDLKRRQAHGSPGGADDQVRVGDQPQDGEGARPHDSAVSAGARGRGDSVMDRSELSRCLPRWPGNLIRLPAGQGRARSTDQPR